ncbi:MAG: CPBP family intramembrane metalloprotease [Lachnospiraceae bacterium]|nr:CPBP family intramembrane metalloprotease [Lachnospiraceae bacterium]MBR5943830.1 CPBP family intramembrane metalloprotease [Lachnospiraceae bacterium]
MSLSKKNFSAVGFTYGGMIILVSAIQIGIGQLFQFFAPEIIEDYFWLYFLIAMLPSYIIGYPMVKFFMDKREKTQIERRRLLFSDFLIFLCMAEAFMIVGSFIGNYVNNLITSFTGIEIEDTLTEVMTNSVLWVNVLLAGILAPIFEELLFRKLLIDNAVKYGEGLAIFVSGFAFGLFHGNFGQFFYAAMVGMLFAYVYVRTGNIKYTIILHMIVNLCSTLITPIYNMVDPDLISGELEPAEIYDMLRSLPAQELISKAWPILAIGLYVILIYGMGIAGLILFFVKRKRMFLIPGERDIYPGYRFKSVVLNPGAIFFILACAATFLLSILW